MIDIKKNGNCALICVIILGLLNPIFAQDKKAYTICANDKLVPYSELLNACLEADIVFFGELHIICFSPSKGLCFPYEKKYVT